MGIVEFIIVFLALLAVGLPIAFVMLLSSTAYFLFSGNDVFLRMLPEKMFAGIDVFVLMAIPFFLLVGEIMNRAKLTDRLFDFCNMFIGRVRGGLAQVNVVSSILFAGVTGIALGDVASQGKMFQHAMERQGYTAAFTAAVTAASSLVGAVIPPSTIIIVYCAVLNESVGAMFSAAVIPGLLLGLSQVGIVQYLAVTRNFPKVHVEVTATKFIRGFLDAFFAVIMPIIIIRGIVAGWFTPTEAAAICVVYSLFVGFVLLRTLKLADLPPIFTTASMDTARLFFIIAGASATSWVFAMEGLPELVKSLFADISHNQLVVVLAINLFFLFCGMWLDASISIILFAPVLEPLALSVGLHPVQFGIMVIVNCVLGLITPPVGNVLFVCANIARLSIGELGRALMPFIIGGFVILMMIGLWPAVTMALPRWFGLVQP